MRALIAAVATGQLTVQEAAERIGAVTFDQEHGLGATGNNRDVDYFGYTAWMRPHQFLSLNPKRHDVAQHVDAHVEAGGAIASPFLNVRWHEPTKSWHVEGHEGRGRAELLHRTQPDVPIPVHIIPKEGLRARHLTDEHLFAPLRSDKRQPLAYTVRPRRVHHEGIEKHAPGL